MTVAASESGKGFEKVPNYVEISHAAVEKLSTSWGYSKQLQTGPGVAWSHKQAHFESKPQDGKKKSQKAENGITGPTVGSCDYNDPKQYHNIHQRLTEK